MVNKKTGKAGKGLPAWLKAVLIVAGLLVAIAIALPFVVPLNFLIPKFEQYASSAFEQPISIVKVRVALLPHLRFTLDDVSVGILRDSRIETVEILPDPATVMDDVITIPEIRLSGVRLTQETLIKLPFWEKKGKSARVILKKILFDRMELKSESPFNLGQFSGQLLLSTDQNMEEAKVYTLDGKVNASIKPVNRGYSLEITANNWTVPNHEEMTVEDLSVKGKLSSGQLKIDEIEARIFDGTLSGTGALSWQGMWQLETNLHGKKLKLEKIPGLFTTDTSVSGKMDSYATCSFVGNSVEEMFANPTVEMVFSIESGEIGNFDLVRAVRAPAKKGMRGGRTKFDVFSGAMTYGNQEAKLSQLHVGSGPLNAEGDIHIQADKEMSGSANVVVTSSTNSFRSKLRITGSLGSPVLIPN